MAKELISHPELLRVLDYNPETGLFTWKVQVSRCVLAGTPAGFLWGKFYLGVRYKGVGYLVHRLAWFYVHGTWPEAEIDHRDGDKKNNRIANLRVASHALNCANRQININNSSGAKGVSQRPNNRWRAAIEHEGRSISLGTYGSLEEASAAYLDGAKKLHGDFARAA